MRTKSIRNNFIKGAIAVLCAAIVLFVTSRILLLLDFDGIAQVRSLYKQPKNTVDLLMIGGSHVHANINTGELWDEHGIASYELSTAEQPLWSTYYLLREMYKSQSPKVVALEISSPAMHREEVSLIYWVESTMYGMKWGSNRVNIMKSNSTGEESWDYLLPLHVMHGRYNDLEEKDFTDEGVGASFKGFHPINVVAPQTKSDLSHVTGREPLSDKNAEYLQKIIDLAAEHQSELLFFCTPYVAKEEEQVILNTISDIADANGIMYLDGNADSEAIGIDFETDFRDDTHLNFSGSDKYTEYFGNVVTDTFHLPDHRGDAKYASWDADALRWRTLWADESMRYNEDGAYCLQTAADPAYITVISVGNINTLSNLTPPHIYSLSEAGIQQNMILPDTVYVVNNGQILFQNSSLEFKMSVPIDTDTLYISRKSHESGEDDGHLFSTRFYYNTESHDLTGSGIEIFIYDMVNHDLVKDMQLLP